jgi:hypothetical protein
MMKKEHVFLASTGSSLVKAEKVGQQWVVSHALDGIKVNGLVSDPNNSQIVFLATQKNGVYKSNDAGETWQPSGLSSISVKSLAVDPSHPQTIYAGCKPVSLYVSHDAGNSWEELAAMRKTRKWWWLSPADPPGMTPYVSGLTVSPNNPQVLLAGIEVGATMLSLDGGLTWSSHLRGSQLDCHSLKFHPEDGDWAYEGGGGGVSFSRDGGRTWAKPKLGLGSKYGWMVAADPERPDLWYLSASEAPNLIRGDFTPPAHNDGQARAHIYRKVRGEPWEQLSGGLPEPLDYMAYDLAAVPGQPGHLYAGLSNGQVWHTGDYGDHWEQLPFNLGRVQNGMILI